MFDEDKILSDLKALLGKEFYLTEFCKSNKYNFDEFTKYFFVLDEEEKINFLISLLLIVLIKFKVEIILFSQYLTGLLSDSPTALSAAKCTTQSTDPLCLLNALSREFASSAKSIS